MKKYLAMIAMLALSWCACADYLYWALEPMEGQDLEFRYAKVAAWGDPLEEPIYLKVGDTGVELIAGNKFPDDSTEVLANYSLLPTLPSGYTYDGLSFMIELYNVTNDRIGISQVATYAQLVQQGSIYHDMSTAGTRPENLYHFTAHVPEPTSGVLFAIGLGLLALRRKRA